MPELLLEGFLVAAFADSPYDVADVELSRNLGSK